MPGTKLLLAMVAKNLKLVENLDLATFCTSCFNIIYSYFSKNKETIILTDHWRLNDGCQGQISA